MDASTCSKTSNQSNHMQHAVQCQAAAASTRLLRAPGKGSSCYRRAFVCAGMACKQLTNATPAINGCGRQCVRLCCVVAKRTALHPKVITCAHFTASHASPGQACTTATIQSDTEGWYARQPPLAVDAATDGNKSDCNFYTCQMPSDEDHLQEHSTSSAAVYVGLVSCTCLSPEEVLGQESS